MSKPSFRIEGGKLKGNSAFPGLVIQYSTNDGTTWSDLGDGAMVTGRVTLGTRLVFFKGKSK